ncbi:MAG: hypothetical protein WCD59_04440, partial [Pseudolabrys sp.]
PVGADWNRTQFVRLNVFYISYMFRVPERLPVSFLRNESARFALCFYADIVPPVQIPHGGANNPNVA